MTWDEIRTAYPNRWVVIEATEAHTDGARRVLDQIALIAAFGDDYMIAWKRYKALHHASPEREYYVAHTDREQLDIGVLDMFGRRAP
ncbi:MAG: hypothetical protein AAF125_07830 [Chloroflexota bacterium]